MAELSMQKMPSECGFTDTQHIKIHSKEKESRMFL